MAERFDSTEAAVTTSLEASSATRANPRYTELLHRASGLLLGDRIAEAKLELERALELEPLDPRGRDLLAGVLYRLGLTERAVELWRRLVEEHPGDVDVRTRLALALAKLGRSSEARDELRRVVTLRPTDRRASTYLAVLAFRLGDAEEARDAFVAAGETGLARRIEDAVDRARRSGGIGAGDSRNPGADEQLRRVADEAARALEGNAFALATPDTSLRPMGDFAVRELGREDAGRTEVPRSLPPPPPRSLRGALSDWASPPIDAGMSVGARGELFLRGRGLLTRPRGIVAGTGRIEASVAVRTQRGRVFETPLGGDQPLIRIRDDVRLVLRPPEGKRFTVLTLDATDVVYVREPFLQAASGELVPESGQLSIDDEDMWLVQFRGPGVLALVLDREPVVLHVGREATLRVDPNSLVGWSGHLFPVRSGGTSPYGAFGPALELRGEGSVLLG